MKITNEISNERVSDLLCCALEGGSNYWYCIDFKKSVKPEKIDYGFCGYEEEGVKKVFKHLNWPLTGGRLFIYDREDDLDEIDPGTSGFLDIPACEKGLKLMSEKYPKHFSDFMKEEEDAETGDVFLQLALFGSIVFG